MRHLGDARDVEDVETRVAERLAEQETRLGADRCAPGIDVARVDERRRDAEPRQRVVEQVVRAAVQRARRDDVRNSAACPLAVAIAPTPPSSAATRSSSTAQVGLDRRE
jgi:hypothetical protein